MAVKVKAVDTFKQAMLGCIELEKTKRGLGKMFHSAVVDLLNENPGSTGEELAEVFLSTMTEVENTLRSELVEAFGEDFELKEAMPSWTQYKSDYKQALLKVDRRDLIKCGGVADVKKALGEVRKAMKEKAEGGASTDSNPADNGGSDKAAGGKADDKFHVSGLSGIPASARESVAEALKALAQLDDATAAEVALHFKNAAWGRARAAMKKLNASGVNGSSNKAA